MGKGRYDAEAFEDAPVAELVDAPDSKSGGLWAVSVRVRPGAPFLKSTTTKKGALKRLFELHLDNFILSRHLPSGSSEPFHF